MARIATGSLAEAAIAVRHADPAVPHPLVFDNSSGRVVDLNLSRSDAEIAARYAPMPEDANTYATRLLTGTFPPMMTYLDPTPASGAALIRRGLTGPVVMLNLLKFRETADYSANPGLAPDRPISGAAAFDRYAAHTAPFSRKPAAW